MRLQNLWKFENLRNEQSKQAKKAEGAQHCCRGWSPSLGRISLRSRHHSPAAVEDDHHLNPGVFVTLAGTRSRIKDRISCQERDQISRSIFFEIKEQCPYPVRRSSTRWPCSRKRKKLAERIAVREGKGKGDQHKSTPSVASFPSPEPPRPSRLSRSNSKDGMRKRKGRDF